MPFCCINIVYCCKENENAGQKGIWTKKFKGQGVALALVERFLTVVHKVAKTRRKWIQKNRSESHRNMTDPQSGRTLLLLYCDYPWQPKVKMEDSRDPPFLFGIIPIKSLFQHWPSHARKKRRDRCDFFLSFLWSKTQQTSALVSMHPYLAFVGSPA